MGRWGWACWTLRTFKYKLQMCPAHGQESWNCYPLTLIHHWLRANSKGINQLTSTSRLSRMQLEKSLSQRVPGTSSKRVWQEKAKKRALTEEPICQIHLSDFLIAFSSINKSWKKYQLSSSPGQRRVKFLIPLSYPQKTIHSTSCFPHNKSSCVVVPGYINHTCFNKKEEKTVKNTQFEIQKIIRSKINHL